jgi:hydroxyacylglutathione hydrolase
MARELSPVDLVADTSDLRIERLETGSWATNCYIVVCPQTGDSVLIDVPPGARTIVKHLQGTNLRYILLTHSHIDHYTGLKATRDRIKAPVAVHAADSRKWLPFPPEILLTDGDVITAGKVHIEALYTPGHTPGSMCFRVGDHLLAGDTLFPGGPGRTPTPADFGQMVRSLKEKIFVLPDRTRIYPGHGPATTLGKEKREFAMFASRHHDPTLCGDVVWLTS